MPFRVSRKIYLLLALAICAAAVYVLSRDIQALTMDQIALAWRSMKRSQVSLSLLLTSVSFVALGGYDVLAVLILVPRKIPSWLAWLAGAAGNAVSNTLGFHAVTGSLVRYRLYRRAGLQLSDVASVIAFSWASLAFGFATVLGLALLAHGPNLAATFGGGGLIAILAAILRWLGRVGRSISVGGLSLTLPSAGTAAVQMAIGAVEMLAAIGALYVLMPSAPGSFAGFVAAYIGAVLLGIVSHTPGGIGVFEAAMLSFAGSHDQAGALAALLLYRLLYNLVPFALAVLALLGFEALNRSQLNWKEGSVG